jgi:hypothetical protein
MEWEARFPGQAGLISGDQRVVYSNRDYAKELWIYFSAEVVRITLVL